MRGLPPGPPAVPEGMTGPSRLFRHTMGRGEYHRAHRRGCGSRCDLPLPRIIPAAPWENHSSLADGLEGPMTPVTIFRRSVSFCGQQRKTWRHFLCRPESRWWAVNRGACVRCSSYRTIPATVTVLPSSLRPSPLRPAKRVSTHIEFAAGSYGLPKDTVVLLEQIRTLDKKRLREHMGRLDSKLMRKVDSAIAVSFGLHPQQMV